MLCCETASNGERMSPISDKKRDELEKNFQAMSERMNEYIQIHANKYALMRDGEVVEFYNTWEDAYKTGMKFFKDEMFSVQQVTKTPVDLGFFSHAVDLG